MTEAEEVAAIPLVEEIHVLRRTETKVEEIAVVLRSEHAELEREGAEG